MSEIEISSTKLKKKSNKKTTNYLPQILSFLYKFYIIVILTSIIGVLALIVAQNEIINQRENERNIEVTKQLNDIRNWQTEFEKKVFANKPNQSEPKPAQPNNTDYRLGKADAKYTLLVYNDFECPFCKRAYPIEKEFIERNKADISLVFRHFPIEQIHPNAFRLAKISECAYEQKGDAGFFESVDTIFGSSNLKDLQDQDFARLLNLNSEKLNICLSSEKTTKKVKDQQKEGEQAGIFGTPAIFIFNNQTGEFIFINGLTSLEDLQNSFNSFKIK